MPPKTRAGRINNKRKVAEIQIVADQLLAVRENNHAHVAYEQGRFAAEVLSVHWFVLCSCWGSDLGVAAGQR